MTEPFDDDRTWETLTSIEDVVTRMRLWREDLQAKLRAIDSEEDRQRADILGGPDPLDAIQQDYISKIAEQDIEVDRRQQEFADDMNNLQTQGLPAVRGFLSKYRERLPPDLVKNIEDALARREAGEQP